MRVGIFSIFGVVGGLHKIAVLFSITGNISCLNFWLSLLELKVLFYELIGEIHVNHDGIKDLLI
jgi:hypothetical protein